MWFRKKKANPKEVLKLWGIVEGPFHREEVEGEEDNEQEWMLVMKISKGEEVSESQIWFDTFQDVYQITRYFDKNIEPLELEISSD